MSKAIDKAYARIRDGIIAGELAPGQHLKEEELAELCGVSRTPVRDALRRLEADYFVERHDNQRVFVSSWSDSDIEDIFVLRAMLEGYATARAAKNITPEQLAAQEGHHQAILSGIGDDGTIETDLFMENNRAFHTIILEAAQSQRLSIMLQRLVEQPVVMRTLIFYSPKDLARSTQQHADILEALRANDEVWANAAMTGHIRHAHQVFKRSQALHLEEQQAAAE